MNIIAVYQIRHNKSVLRDAFDCRYALLRYQASMMELKPWREGFAVSLRNAADRLRGADASKGLFVEKDHVLTACCLALRPLVVVCCKLPI